MKNRINNIRITINSFNIDKFGICFALLLSSIIFEFLSHYYIFQNFFVNINSVLTSKIVFLFILVSSLLNNLNNNDLIINNYIMLRIDKKTLSKRIIIKMLLLYIYLFVIFTILLIGLSLFFSNNYFSLTNDEAGNIIWLSILINYLKLFISIFVLNVCIKLFSYTIPKIVNYILLGIFGIVVLTSIYYDSLYICGSGLCLFQYINPLYTVLYQNSSTFIMMNSMYCLIWIIILIICCTWRFNYELSG